MTATIEEPRIIFCPEWCNGLDREHGVDREAATGRPIMSHVGPTFGRFCTAAETYLDVAPGQASINAEVRPFDLDDVPMTPEALRQLAADALDAAEWLEANQ